MSIKSVIFSIFAVAAISGSAMAQGGQPNQPPKDGDRAEKRGGERMDRVGRGRRSGGMGMMKFSRF